MKQKILAVAVMVICLVTAATASVFAETSDELSIEKTRAYNFLEGLGIFKSDMTDPDREMTRGEMVEVLGNIVNHETSGNEEFVSEFFDDVEDPQMAEQVDFLYQLGVVSGTGERKFEPDAVMQSEQLIACIIKLLGYERYASVAGGYPNGYMVSATALDLFKNTSAQAGVALKESDMVLIVCNALKVNLADDELEYTLESNPKETLLTRWHDIYSGTGTVTDDGVTSITGASKIDSDMVQIGDDVMNKGECSPYDYIGQDVNYYYHDDGNQTFTLVYMETVKKTQETVTINADEIDKTDRYTISYYPESSGGKKVQNVKISPVATVIYNGKSYLQYTAEELDINSGTITLIDPEYDGEYDIVYIKEYKSLVFDSYREYDGKVTLSDAYSSSRNLEYKTDETNIRILREGEYVTPEELEQWDVLNVMASKPDDSARNFIDIVVTIEPVGGEITSVFEDQITVSGIEYEISKDYMEASEENNYAPKLVSGKAGILLLDIDGKVGGFKEISQYQYIYATTLFVDDVTEPVIATLRGYEWEKGFVDLQFAERVTINEVTGKIPEVLTRDENFVISFDGTRYTIKPQLLRIKVNSEGLITKIETAKDMTGETSLEERTTAASNDVFRKCTENEDLPYRGAGSFSGKVYPVSSTRVMVVPKDDVSLTKIFESRDGLSFDYDTSYDIITYNESIYNVPEYIIVNKSGASGGEGDTDTLKKAPFYVHDGFKTKLNEDDVAVNVFYGLQNGEQVEKSPVEDFVLINEPNSIMPEDLEFGSVVQLGEDAEGNVNFIREWYKPSMGFVKSGTSDDYRQNWRSLISGQVMSVSGDGNYIIVDDGKLYTYDLSSAVVTICDLESESIYPGEKTEISVGDQIAIRIRETRVHEVVVYKNLEG